MKKKSFFGINAKLALMLVAICGMFASCYEKEELTTEAPSTVAPVYKITGVVANAITGEPLGGVKVNDATTGADGTYTLDAKEGMNVLKITKDEFRTVTTSVYVEKIANGQAAVYTANAAMYPGKDDPTYKTVKYNIKGTAANNAGSAVALKSVVIAGISNVTVSGNTFTVEDVKPGTYAAVLTADGYNKSFASISVVPVNAQEGNPEDVQQVISEISVLMQKPGEQAKYIVKGIVKNEKTEGVDVVVGASVKLSTNNGFTAQATTNSKGEYSFEIPFEYVTPTTVGFVTISKDPYKTETHSFMIQPDEKETTVTISSDFVLQSISGQIPDEDVSVGGNTTVEVPVEETKPVPVEEALKNEEVKSGIEQVAKELGIDLSAITNIPTVEVTTDAVMPLISSEAVKDEEGNITGEVQAVEDQVTIPAGTQIFYVAGEAKNISLTRDIATEKVTAAVRTYEGQPSGTVFSKPLEIKFEAPAAVTVEPDYVLGVLYLNEKDNTWKADEGNYAEYDMTSKRFVGQISHFSKFKFGYESDIVSKDSVNLPKEYITKPCFTGAYSKLVTVKGKYLGGSAYVGETPAMAAAAKLQGMNQETVNYVAQLLTNMIKTDNANIMPENDYKELNVSADITIPAYTQVNGFNMIRKEAKKTYTVHVITKDKKPIDVAVTVKKVISVTIDADMAIGHTHGHGNGQDLNAGGGIVEFE